MVFVREAEIAVLFGHTPSRLQDGGCGTELLESFLHGKYEDVLKHGIGEKLLKENPGNKDTLAAIVSHNVETYILNSDRDKDIVQLEVLLVGASCLQLFVQNNWTGPLTDKQATEYLAPSVCQSNKAFIEYILGDLSQDGAPVYSLARHITYLFLARIIFLDCRDHLKSLQTSDWWLMRFVSLHQDLLEEKSPTHKATVLGIIDEVSKREPLITSDDNRDVAILFHLEAGHLCHTFYEYRRATACFGAARKLSGLQVELTGALGKRTKFQQEAKAQLMLKVSRPDTECSTGTFESKTDEVIIPKNVPLDDDTVLDGVQLAEGEREFCVRLSQLDQAVVLGIMEDYKRKMAIERLTEEEILTYVIGIIDHMSSWCVGTTCLALRSKLQWDSRRRVERSMNQYEELVSQTDRPSPPVIRRQNLFYASKMPSIWYLQKNLATLLLSLGLVGAGLEIYERLQMWEEAIACYQTMGKLEKAESLIREQLKVKETPNLYCFLGDVTRNADHYHKAWELSNRRSARAMRCLGYLYFGRQEYAQSMECFEKSLEINALQIPVWFTYGCTAMTVEKYEEAAGAFRRCLHIEADNFEAWGNLSTCLVKMKKLPAAFKVLKDAIKYNFENWRLWDNYLTIGTDIGEFEDVIHAYHRLMDIKQKWTDVQVLRILVNAVTENLKDAGDQPSARLRPKLQELFGRVTAAVTTESEIWRLYSKLVSSVEHPDQTTSEKAVQYLQKAHRCVMQTSGWEKDVDQCVIVAKQSQQLATEHLKFAERGAPSQAINSLSSAKLMLRSLLVKLKQANTDPVTQTLAEKLQKPCDDLSASLDTIVRRIDELKGT
ncbi:tetratricopeptide repeat protein 27-like [Haliotis rufescens]|uniref:tetratricopeptide repeat protein 27-like n=1 Tax=Haliotis rufescens TaxID=6454 RepID=UPI00201EA175|nr:tetratricopeptide repeat protein 27-like [Haliotis rufescens]